MTTWSGRLGHWESRSFLRKAQRVCRLSLRNRSGTLRRSHLCRLHTETIGAREGRSKGSGEPGDGSGFGHLTDN